MKKFDYKKWVVKNKHGNIKNTPKKKTMLNEEGLIGPKTKAVQDWIDAFWEFIGENCTCPPPFTPCGCLGSYSSGPTNAPVHSFFISFKRYLKPDLSDIPHVCFPTAYDINSSNI